MQQMSIPNVWGHINLVANGAGQAIAQLDVSWGVDYEPFKVTIFFLKKYVANKKFEGKSSAASVQIF